MPVLKERAIDCRIQRWCLSSPLLARGRFMVANVQIPPICSVCGCTGVRGNHDAPDMHQHAKGKAG